VTVDPNSELARKLRTAMQEMFLSAKQIPEVISPFADRDRFVMGTLSHMVIHSAGEGYEALEDFPQIPPDTCDKRNPPTGFGDIVSPRHSDWDKNDDDDVNIQEFDSSESSVEEDSVEEDSNASNASEEVTSEEVEEEGSSEATESGSHDHEVVTKEIPKNKNILKEEKKESKKDVSTNSKKGKEIANNAKAAKQKNKNDKEVSEEEEEPEEEENDEDENESENEDEDNKKKKADTSSSDELENGILVDVDKKEEEREKMRIAQLKKKGGEEQEEEEQEEEEEKEVEEEEGEQEEG